MIINFSLIVSDGLSLIKRAVVIASGSSSPPRCRSGFQRWAYGLVVIVFGVG